MLVPLSVTSSGSFSRMLKNAHLRRFPRPSSLQRTHRYASLLGISGALHLGIFEHPENNHLFSSLNYLLENLGHILNL
jgi:hypothetical protein